MTRGLVLGKFLPYHTGHAHLIESARAAVDELTVLVCSIPREPIPGALRFRWVRDSHPDCRVLHVAEELPQFPEEDPEFWAIWADVVARYAGRVDVVFTSESYGDELAHRLGAGHVCVDRDRRAMPVSGTAIRNAPLTNWRFIPPVVRPYYALRVAIVGTESVGKSTLAARLAAELGTAWVAEYGRDYCEVRPAESLDVDDLAAIAWGQATWEEERARDAQRVLICDTDLHVTATWSDLLVSERPLWLTAAARARRYDLVVLLEPDVPWIQDGLRVLRDRRERHTAMIRRELEDAGRRYVSVGGPFELRHAAVARLIDDLIGERMAAEEAHRG